MSPVVEFDLSLIQSFLFFCFLFFFLGALVVLACHFTSKTSTADTLFWSTLKRILNFLNNQMYSLANPERPQCQRMLFFVCLCVSMFFFPQNIVSHDFPRGHWEGIPSKGTGSYAFQIQCQKFLRRQMRGVHTAALKTYYSPETNNGDCQMLYLFLLFM